MMTSNRLLEDWAKLIGDVPAATAILDRFLQHATLINVTRKNYRLRHDGAEKKTYSNRGRRSTGGVEAFSPKEDTVAESTASSVAGAHADQVS